MAKKKNNEFVDWVETYKDDSGEYRWRAMSNNGKEVAASGEGFTNPQYAVDSAKAAFPKAVIRGRMEEE